MGPGMGPGGPSMGPAGPGMAPCGPSMGCRGPAMGGPAMGGPAMGGPSMGPGGMPHMQPGMGQASFLFFSHQVSLATAAKPSTVNVHPTGDARRMPSWPASIHAGERSLETLAG